MAIRFDRVRGADAAVVNENYALDFGLKTDETVCKDWDQGLLTK